MTKSGASCLQSIRAHDVAADDFGWSPESVPCHDAEEVITRLYKDNGTFILGYVTGLLRDRYLAEDVVQETMLRAWRHRDVRVRWQPIMALVGLDNLYGDGPPSTSRPSQKLPESPPSWARGQGKFQNEVPTL